MTAFRGVSHDDQIQLLKGGSIELLMLRSVLTFDKDKQQFLDPLDPEETAAVKVASFLSSVTIPTVSTHAAYCIIVLLSCVSLTPYISTLVHMQQLLHK